MKECQMILMLKKKNLTGYSKEQVDKWDSKTKISQGKKYIKVVQENGVFGFIVKRTLNILKKVIY